MLARLSGAALAVVCALVSAKAHGAPHLAETRPAVALAMMSAMDVLRALRCAVPNRCRPAHRPRAKQTPQNRKASMNDDLTLSPAGLKLVQSFEGCEKAVKGSRRFKAYLDPVGILTIGWGHTNATGRRFSADTVWTQAECDAVLREDIAKFESAVRGLAKVELEQCQFDALVSFAYNCGVGNLKSSTLLRKVNRRDFSAAAREFAKWNKAGGHVLKGLTRRRAAEATLFAAPAASRWTHAKTARWRNRSTHPPIPASSRPR